MLKVFALDVASVVIISFGFVRCLPCDDARQNLAVNGTYNTANQDIPCIDPCDKFGQIISTQSDCQNHTFCHWNGSFCSLKTVRTVVVNKNRNINLGLAEKLKEDIGDGRTVITGIDPLTPPWCLKFPASCHIDPYDPNNLNLLDPPVNIPYCKRIPCRNTDPSLEFDGIACHSVPGCYFDAELFNLRYYFGHSIMSGVPVCHMAIRNRKFHQLVNEYTDNGAKPWNGLFTNCFLEENRKSIYAPDSGCYMIDVLEYMGVRPKLAGWENITKTECDLIGGCFRQDCYVPMKTYAVNLRAGTTEPAYAPLESVGAQRCQRLDRSLPPGPFLSAYHQCKQSGCVVDRSVDIDVKQHLLNITLTHIPPDIRLLFWYLVQSNFVGPDNWQHKADELMRNPQDFIKMYRGVDWMHFKNRLGQIMNKRPFGRQPEDDAELSASDRFLLLHPQFAASEPSDIPQPPIPVPFPNFSSIPVQPFCPFQLFSFNGLFPLKGIFDGCCQQNLCYTPRHHISGQASGVASYWAEWGAWGTCSETCGNGIRRSVRRCVRLRESDSCEGSDKQDLYCFLEKCPDWAAWGNWGSCSKTCGGGQSMRRRECEGVGCRGESKESRICKTEDCPVLGDWTEWSECNATCSAGVQQRCRSCDDSQTTLSCPPPADLKETQVCDDFCGSIVETSKSKCQGFPACAITRKYECQLNTEHGPVEGHCQNFKAERKQRCYGSFRCRFCHWWNNCSEVE